MAAVAGIYGFSEERHTRYSDLRQHHTIVIVVVPVESHSVDVLRKMLRRLKIHICIKFCHQ
ncbi:potassium voltage-gated channel protein Shaker isoform X6 [Vespula squamosa]|uniref:Potassium voltage-gated channel protein Shaker isoform X6 n=1 Tax=Vespula squamosa TaxID=30214 RepID=A0ABD2AH32_VESSQ